MGNCLDLLKNNQSRIIKARRQVSLMSSRVQGLGCKFWVMVASAESERKKVKIINQVTHNLKK